MGVFDRMKKTEGGYLFLSHSHSDIERVREIRNSLEKYGFEPLCFYLKCLDDDSEIEDLIKREIDAREWFIFVDSDNSRKSKWVTLEREYITRTNSKKIITIDIDNEKSVSEAIHKISHNLRVFFSYAHKDIDLARRIKNKMEEKDYLVYFPPDSITTSDFASELSDAVSEASQEGCVLALITEESVNSSWMKKEIALAIHQGGNVVPVFVGDAEPDGILKFFFSNISCARLSENPTDEEIDSMVSRIGDIFLKN